MTTIVAPIFGGCTRLIGDLQDPKCDAFPVGIPREIVFSEKDHRKQFAGDNGLQFSPRNAEAAEHADLSVAPRWPAR
jgi:hypothetical protein